MKFLLLITMLIFSVSSFADNECLINKADLNLEDNVALSGEEKVNFCDIKDMPNPPDKPSSCTCPDADAATGEAPTPSNGSQCAEDPSIEDQGTEDSQDSGNSADTVKDDA